MSSAPFPARRLAIVTCMDARIDPLAALGAGLGDAHVIRNAGAMITEDAIRSLALSQRLLETRAVAIVGHTDCGLEGLNDAAVLQEIASDAGRPPPWRPGSFEDVERHVRESVRAGRECPYLTYRDDVRGYVLEVENGGGLREVT